MKEREREKEEQDGGGGRREEKGGGREDGGGGVRGGVGEGGRDDGGGRKDGGEEEEKDRASHIIYHAMIRFHCFVSSRLHLVSLMLHDFRHEMSDAQIYWIHTFHVCIYLYTKLLYISEYLHSALKNLSTIIMHARCESQVSIRDRIFNLEGDVHMKIANVPLSTFYSSRY